MFDVNERGSGNALMRVFIFIDMFIHHMEVLQLFLMVKVLSDNL